MKKRILTTTTANVLLILVLSVSLFSACDEKDPEYTPVVLAPDFELLNVDYDFDNESLNSESVLTFNVEYRNNEVSEIVYPSVLNFYVDGEIQESKQLEDIVAQTSYESIFEWEASAGTHDFTFEINIASDGSEFIEETNTANNTQTTNFTVAVKELIVAQEEVVDPVVLTESLDADPESDMTSVLLDEGITIASDAEVLKTTYSDNTSAIVAAVANSDGTIDPTKVVLAITSNAGVTEGQTQEATTAMLVEIQVDEQMVSFYNAKDKLIYKAGVVSFEKLKSASAFTPCSELTNMELFNAKAEAVADFSSKVDAAIASDGVEAGLEQATAILIQTLTAYEFTQGGIDNAPTYTLELTNSSEVCSTNCVDDSEEIVYAYPGFILHFSDDRNDGVVEKGTSEVISSFTQAPSCSASNNGTYTFSDCGDNEVSITFSSTQIKITTSNQCNADNHY